MLMSEMLLLFNASGTMVVGLRAIEQVVAADHASVVWGASIRVPILVYHSIAPHHIGQTGEQRELDVDTALFRAQMNYIARVKHPVVPFSALVDALDGKGR